MISILATLGTITLVVFAGHALLRRLRFTCSSGPAWFGWAFLVGSCCLATMAAILSPLALAHPWALAIGLALLGASLSKPPTSEVNGGWIDFAPVLVIGAAITWQAFATPTWNPDALLRWGMHAKWLAHDFSLTPALSSQSNWAFSHPSYPPLLPSLGGLAIGLGGDAQNCLRLLSPTFFIALIGIVTGFCTKHCGRRTGNLLALCLALTPCLSWMTRAGNLSGIESVGLGAAAFLADLPLALALTSAAILILEAGLDRRQRTQEWCLAIACIAAVLSKQEGLPSILAMLILAAIILPQKRWLMRPALLALSSFGVWRLITWNVVHADGEHYLSSGGLQAISDGLLRAPLIMERITSEMSDPTRWGALWPAATILVACTGIGFYFKREQNWRPAIACLAWLEAGILIAILGFLSSGWKDGNISLLMDVSISRLLVHFAPCAILALACALHASSKKG